MFETFWQALFEEEKKKNNFYLNMCFVYIGFEIINNVQDLSVYAVVKAIIFL